MSTEISSDNLHQLREIFNEHLGNPLFVDVGNGFPTFQPVMEELAEQHQPNLVDLLLVPTLMYSHSKDAAQEQCHGVLEPTRPSRKRPLDIQTEQPRSRNHPKHSGKAIRMQVEVDVMNKPDVRDPLLNDCAENAECVAKRPKENPKKATICPIC